MSPFVKTTVALNPVTQCLPRASGIMRFESLSLCVSDEVKVHSSLRGIQGKKCVHMLKGIWLTTKCLQDDATTYLLNIWGWFDFKGIKK